MIFFKKRNQNKTQTFLLIGSFMLMWTLLLITDLSTNARATDCKSHTFEAHGNATSKDKSKRNARIKLHRSLEKQFPGDSKRRFKNGIKYSCKESFLWLCKASIKTCK